MPVPRKARMVYTDQAFYEPVLFGHLSAVSSVIHHIYEPIQ